MLSRNSTANEINLKNKSLYYHNSFLFEAYYTFLLQLYTVTYNANGIVALNLSETWNIFEQNLFLGVLFRNRESSCLNPIVQVTKGLTKKRVLSKKGDSIKRLPLARHSIYSTTPTTYLPEVLGTHCSLTLRLAYNVVSRIHPFSPR